MDIQGTVRLETAFTWRCPKCGKRFFERSLKANMTDDEIREMIGLIPGESIPEEFNHGDWVMEPETVTCSCGAIYQTEQEENS